MTVTTKRALTCLLLPVAAFLLAGEFALQSPELLLRLLQRFGVFIAHAI